MDNQRFCVIMAGGYGNHFWPMSREDRPKQFLIGLTKDGKSLTRSAYEQCLEVVPKENILVVTLDKFAHFVRDQIPEIGEENLLLEPYGRKTGPCIVYSIYKILKRCPDAVAAFIPADIVIPDSEQFRSTVSSALDYAQEHKVLLSIGIRPKSPSPNYGYLQVAGGRLDAASKKPVKVKTFVEKPSKELAEIFCKSGEFLWNSGIFVWKASVIKEEMEKCMPEITSMFTGWEGAFGTSAERELLEKAYADCFKISIDNGVMERTDKAWVFLANFDWYDIDNWTTLCNYVNEKDRDGNIVRVGKEYLSSNKDSIIASSSRNKLVAVKGLKDYIVIDTPDVLLICPRDDSEYKNFLGDLLLPGYEDYK